MYEQHYIWINNINPLWALLISAAIFIINFIPSFIAFSRRHPNRLAILIFNALFGWTGIGWIILLVWALQAPRGGVWLNPRT